MERINEARDTGEQGGTGSTGRGKKSGAQQIIGLVIGGCTLLGIGLGKLLGNPGAFTMLGIGAGLLIAALIHFKRSK